MANHSDSTSKAAGSMPLSWLWSEKNYDLSHKMVEIENSLQFPYEYGKSQRHAGPIGKGVRREIDRMHKIIELDSRLEKIDGFLKRF